MDAGPGPSVIVAPGAGMLRPQTEIVLGGMLIVLGEVNREVWITELNQIHCPGAHPPAAWLCWKEWVAVAQLEPEQPAGKVQV